MCTAVPMCSYVFCDVLMVSAYLMVLLRGSLCGSFGQMNTYSLTGLVLRIVSCMADSWLRGVYIWRVAGAAHWAPWSRKSPIANPGPW